MTVHAPIPDYAAARAAMVDSQLRPQGVNFPAVLRAMAIVSREQFLPDASRPLAYIDRAVAIGPGPLPRRPAVLGQLLIEMIPAPAARARRRRRHGLFGRGPRRDGARGGRARKRSRARGKAREQGIEVVEGPLESGQKRARRTIES